MQSRKPNKELGKVEIFITGGKLNYRPGDTVTGTVEVTNVAPIQCKGQKKLTELNFEKRIAYM